MNADQQTPFDRLFVQDADDRPDEIVVDELTTMDAEAFVAQLDALAEAAEAITTMAEDLERLRKTGLSDEDARDLIYGRNSDLTKTEIEALVGAIDDVRAGTTGSYDPIERLLADVSDLSLSETRELMGELDRLQRRYGGVDGE
ncbi:hypothetical protein [Haloarcula sp. Atlit-120R]|uniref:hypothetical protein n=1 Tax=Haloarcula sp. Atlit-120R TaxID=2282135 RepID=UPI000EF2881C|nr:hypothetical protein [Haloarcula sp. Atlit-120R]RLM32646.1 hypothetical protein DVK01_20450 [Haloarcula sp. Atlit-120R]